MELVWHNCITHPPKEDYNSCLLLSNGLDIFYAEYFSKTYSLKENWVYKGTTEFVSHDLLNECYWADMRQTISKSKDFIETRSQISQHHNSSN